ncbi:MAG: UbiH/UbiF/VisC/COQ6 family ubiquinone biosynthesis hydroxylase [Zetaproteobacteria bacterium]|nr:UbiH/UbiF/VisC/COQ6 family ubiquinone biosynthesis hydroxylase [Zetaproteobacteria bacterium]
MKSSPFNEQVDLIIVGAGMVGLCLAAALRLQGLKILIVEREESAPFISLGYDCRVSAIVAANIEMFQAIGVWERLQTVASPIHTMRIWDNQHAGGIRFDAEEIKKTALGYLIENSKMQEAMKLTLLQDVNIELYYPAVIQSWQRNNGKLQVRFEDGRVVETPLLVGADGANSWVRSNAEIHLYEHDMHQKGIVANIRTQLPHQNSAYQRFLPTGPLAFLPMINGMISIVWSAQTEEADRLMQLDDIGFIESLNLAMGPVLGRVTEVGQRAAFPLKTRLAAHMIRPNIALIGDAAHTIHPLAGLGVNLGLRDAMILGREILDAIRFKEDYGSSEILSRLIAQRVPDILTVMASMEGLNHIYTSQLPGMPLLRGLGMRMVGNSGIIKQMLMQHSTGLSLPVPKQLEA